MNAKDDRLYLIHIGECIARIETYTAGGRDEFLASSLIQDAVIRNLQTLAESTQRLSDAIKLAQPQTDWKGISGFRNLLVHGYLGVDVEKVWEIIANDLPPLKQSIAAMLAALPGSP
jgi:uncharacterized protein with HEPN domain